MYLLCTIVSEVRLPHSSSWFVLYLSLGLGIRILSVGSDFWLLPHFGFPESFSSKDWVSYPSWSELPHSSIFHFICPRCFLCSLVNVILVSLLTSLRPFTVYVMQERKVVIPSFPMFWPFILAVKLHHLWPKIYISVFFQCMWLVRYLLSIGC